jgi:hypothetical protein
MIYGPFIRWQIHRRPLDARRVFERIGMGFLTIDLGSSGRLAATLKLRLQVQLRDVSPWGASVEPPSPRCRQILAEGDGFQFHPAPRRR